MIAQVKYGRNFRMVPMAEFQNCWRNTAVFSFYRLNVRSFIIFVYIAIKKCKRGSGIGIVDNILFLDIEIKFHSRLI